MSTDLRRRYSALAADVGDPAPFDPIAWRIEQATGVLDRVIPAKFASAAADHPGVAEWVRGYLANPETAPSLLLAGPTGTGKTHQAYGALRAIALHHARHGRGLNWRITTHPDLNAAQRPKPDNSHTWALDPYLDAGLLLLDDLGAGKQTDWTGDTLYRLVDHRWTHQMPTIYTTNFNAGGLEQAVGDRVVSRLADATRVAVKGNDRRWGGNA